jgi:hypothetical protein
MNDLNERTTSFIPVFRIFHIRSLDIVSDFGFRYSDFQLPPLPIAKLMDIAH